MFSEIVFFILSRKTSLLPSQLLVTRARSESKSLSKRSKSEEDPYRLFS